MRVISIRNPDLNNPQQERSPLTADYTSGTALTVLNNFAFATNDIVVIGEPSQEKSESKKVDSISGNTTLNLASALKFSHNKSTNVIKTPWDQVEISSRISGGTWSVLSTSGIQWDKQYTVYVHTSGDSTYDYRWRFYNSVLGTYSEYSPTYSASGFNRNQVGYMVANIRKVTRTQKDTNVITDREIYFKLTEAQDIISAIRNDWWFLKFEDSTMKTVASSYQYNLDLIGGGSAGSPATGFSLGFIDKVRYRYTSGSIDTTYPLKFRSEGEFDMLITDNLRISDDNVNIYTQKPPDSSSKNGYMWVYPTPKTTDIGTFYIRGYKKMEPLNDDIDTTLVPIPQILEYFVMAHIERLRGNEGKADYYEELFYGPPDKAEGRRRLTGIKLLEQLQAQMSPKGQPKQLKRFRGQKALSRYFGNRSIYNRDYIKENFWE